MNDEKARRADRVARTKNIAGLLLMVLGAAALLLTELAAFGWWALPLNGCLLLIWVGWWLATQDVRTGTGPGSPGTPGTVVEVDTEDPDPGAFIPGSPGDPPGTFVPPPPSRDSSRDFEHDSSRDRR